MNYNNIPYSLRSQKSWVCWIANPDINSHSGIKKIPINPVTGKLAKSNDPNTWCSFKEAVSAAERYSGIGFMFSDSGYFGVDLDDCYDDINDYLSGGTNNIVYEFVAGLNSYAEISQSGKGIHIICKGKLPPGPRRRGKIEMYDSGRYFILTGDVCGENCEISECSDAIKPLHEKYLGAEMPKVSVASNYSPTASDTFTAQEVISKAMMSNSGKQFAKLYAGNYDEYGSHSEADLALCSYLAFWTSGNSELMDVIFRSSGLMRDKWDRKQSGSTYGKLTIAKALSDCSNFYNLNYKKDKDTYAISIGKGNTDDEKQMDAVHRYSFDDTGNAQRMYDLCGEVVRYSYIDKRWLYYMNGTWHYDDRGVVFAFADRVLVLIDKECKLWEEYENGKFIELYNKHRKRSRSNAAKRAMVKEMEHLVSISPSDMDVHKTLANSRNGVINLDDCTISPHDNLLYMTRILGTSMPLCPKKPVLWLKFLDDIFNGDKELILYVQKALGYSLSGVTKEQCVFFLYGTGRNGKSTFLEIVRAILGEYASNIQPESIMMKNTSSSANTDIARLKGARLVTSVEPNEGMRLNEGLLKQLTGDDMITARKLYGDEFEYRPEFKLWMATNHKPTIRGTDIGIWRRIHIIPFTVTIPEDKIDKNLGEKLTEELPDILAWMLEGYRLWKSEGLNKPKVVMDAVREYRNEMDVISAFFSSDCCMEGGEIKASVLYAVYCRWATENNEYRMPSRKFGIEVSKRYDKIHKKDGYYYLGISVNTITIGTVVNDSYNS